MSMGIIENGAYKQVAGNVPLQTTYSTEETKTGATWIDGKPIYRKVYHDVLLDGPNSTEWYETNVPVPADIENIVELNALRQWDTTKTTRFLTAGAMTIRANPSDDYLRYMWMTGTTYHGYYDIIAEYTKSTD